MSAWALAIEYLGTNPTLLLPDLRHIVKHHCTLVVIISAAFLLQSTNTFSST